MDYLFTVFPLYIPICPNVSLMLDRKSDYGRKPQFLNWQV